MRGRALGCDGGGEATGHVPRPNSPYLQLLPLAVAPIVPAPPAPPAPPCTYSYPAVAAKLLALDVARVAALQVRVVRVVLGWGWGRPCRCGGMRALHVGRRVAAAGAFVFVRGADRHAPSDRTLHASRGGAPPALAVSRRCAPVWVLLSSIPCLDGPSLRSSLLPLASSHPPSLSPPPPSLAWAGRGRGGGPAAADAAQDPAARRPPPQGT